MQSTSEVAAQLSQLSLSSARLRRSVTLRLQMARDAWRTFAMNRLAVFGVFLILVYAVMSVAHPVLMSTVWIKRVYDPQVGYDMDILNHPSAPSQSHLLGTDTLGRDVLSRLLAATTPTFILALTAAVTTALISTLIAAGAVYYGGLLEILQVHIADVFLLAPAPLIMVVIGGTLDIAPWVFGLIYGAVAGLGGASIVMRSQALNVVHKPYIEASRVAGAGGGQVIFGHMIPNMLPLAAVQMLVSVTGAVFADGFSTFLGLSRTRLNWGSMIYDSFTYQSVNPAITWNVLIPSAMAISLFAAAFYMIARGVHEVAEPRLRSRAGAPFAARHRRVKTAPQAKPIAATLSVRQAAPEEPSPVRLDSPSIAAPDGGEALLWHTFVAARRAWLKGQPAQAAEVYTELIHAQRLLVEVAADLRQALQHHPQEMHLWQALGDAELRLGHFQLAIEAYRRAEQLLQ